MAISGASRSVETHVHAIHTLHNMCIAAGTHVHVRIQQRGPGTGFAFTCHTLGEAILFGPKRLFVPRATRPVDPG